MDPPLNFGATVTRREARVNHACINPGGGKASQGLIDLSA
jgi:hypothetical protein